MFKPFYYNFSLKKKKKNNSCMSSMRGTGMLKDNGNKYNQYMCPNDRFMYFNV